MTRCVFVVDNLRNDQRRGKNNRPWWTRPCKRSAIEGEAHCWQHRTNPPTRLTAHSDDSATPTP